MADIPVAAQRDQLAATREILRAISAVPTQTEALCELILRNALRLAHCQLGAVGLYEGGSEFRCVAVSGVEEVFLQRWLHHRYRVPKAVFNEQGPWRPLQMTAEAFCSVMVPADPIYEAFYARMPQGQALFIPLASGDHLLGTFTIVRKEIQPFIDEEIELVHAFADHAVVALENARTLAALKTQNALHAANAEILRAISESRGDAGPLVDIILRKTCEFTGTDVAGLGLHEGEGRMRILAGRPEAWMTTFGGMAYRFDPKWLQRDGRWSSHYVADLEAVFDPQRGQDVLQYMVRHGLRSILTIPLVSEGRLVGVFHACTRTVRRFSEEQISLLSTFASQAVIALENTRILADLERQNSLHAANAEMLRAISQSPSDPALIFDVILRTTARFTGAEVVGMGLYEDDNRLRFVAGIPDAFSQAWRDVRYLYSERFFRVEGGWRPHVQSDLRTSDAHARGDEVVQQLAQMGIRSMLTVPLVAGDRLVGLFHACHTQIRPFSEDQIATVRAFSDYAVIALENTRLFRALQDKNEELEQASRHKSEFLANMSHELRTPLNAIIGFSEVLKDQFFGALNDKQSEYARDIHDAGHHLLTLINDVLDLAKVEAGRMELLVEPFDLPSAVDSAMIMVRERANRQGVAVTSQVNEHLGRFVGDERKFKQVLLNLLSNAVKFSPAGGLVKVRVEAAEAGVRVSVADEGIGIPESQQRAIFDAFHQAESTLAVKREGTGLGLTLARRFVELHGGSIGVQSRPGAGSTFTFTIREQPWPAS